MLTSIIATFEFTTDPQQRTFQRLCEPYEAHGVEITDIDYIADGIGYILSVDMTDVPLSELSDILIKINSIAAQVGTQTGLHPLYMGALTNFKRSMN